MSDKAPSKQSRRSVPIFAAIALGIAASAGLLLHFGRGTETSAVPALPDNAAEIAPIPATDPAPNPVEPPPPVLDEQADRAAADLDTRLSEMQSEIQRLEAEIASLDAHRARIDAVLARQADLAEQEPMPTATAPEPVAVPHAVDRGGLDEALARLGALPTEQGHRVTLCESELRFEAGQAELGSVKPDVLEQIAEVLKRYGYLQARIEGHTDTKGRQARSQALTQARAQSVRETLSELGVDPGRIQAEGYGGLRPLTDGRTIAAREHNRRIEIYLIEP
jgi:outer membrane protein OmpA-like peptidoglycan-associated protein